MFEGIELAGQVTPLLMFGESHSLAFKDLLFRLRGTDEYFLCRNRFIPKLVASEYSAGNGLSVLFADTLVSEGILDKALRPSFLNMDPSAAFISGQPLIAPPIVFFACDTELIFVLDKLSDRYDFVLPNDPGYGVDRSKQPVPYKDLLTQVERIVDPFVKSLAMLKSVQFSRLMVHCLPPRNADEDAACVFTGGVKIPRTVRAKAALLVNRLLREGCEREGIAFIDTWPEMAVDGYLRPDYALDGIHFNRKAALVSLGKIVENLAINTHEAFNPVRYAQLNAQGQALATHSQAPDWLKRGYVTTPIELDPMLAACAAEPTIAPELPKRMDWVGWLPQMGDVPHMVDPMKLPLEGIHHWVERPEISALLHAGSITDLTVTNLRCRDLFHDSWSQTVLAHSYPVGVRCGVVFLSGNISMHVLNKEGAHEEIDLSAGMLAVYDPARVQLKPTPGAAVCRVLEIALMPRIKGQPLRVMASGAYDWPCDPFQFSMKDMATYPPLGSAVFSARAQWL